MPLSSRSSVSSSSSPSWRLFALLALFVSIQGALAQLLYGGLEWLSSPPTHSGLLGWRVGVCYVLFCTLLSGLALLESHLEGLHAVLDRWGLVHLGRCLQSSRASGHSQKADQQAVVLRSVVQELWQISPHLQPSIYLLPCKEINALSLTLGGRPAHQALLITRGALETLNRTKLKVLIQRQALQLARPSCIISTRLCLFLQGFCAPFTCGTKLLRHAGWSGEQHLVYWVGVIPLLLGLPTWIFARVVLLSIDREETYRLDEAVATCSETVEALMQILETSRKHPAHDLPPSCWLFRSFGLHNKGLLESVLPTQPALLQRQMALRAHSGITTQA